MKIRRYTAHDKDAWDRFVHGSRNGTFILARDYMDYHAGRFPDHSLLAIDADERLVAIVPAHTDADSLVSHAGLTYAGIVSGESMTTPRMVDVVESIVRYLREQGLRRLVYKSVPHIYHRWPAEEDRYALFLHGARLYRRDILSVVRMASRPGLQERRSRAAAKARRHSIRTVESGDLAAYWTILEASLERNYNVRPVHSLAEIGLLKQRFPANIRLHLCLEGAEAIAGVLVYDTPLVAHAQYICASPRGRETGALDLLFRELLDGTYSGRRYFDFGSSCTDEGRTLNAGLVEFKEGFGARGVVHDFYELAVS